MNEAETLDIAPHVRVLLAARNGAEWIDEQLNSVLRQSGVVCDVVVADDCSTDATPQLLRALAEDDTRVTLVERSRGSGSASANFLWLIADVDISGATHVALCDQDDVWHTDKLAVACSTLAASGADLYSCAVIARWDDGQKKRLVQCATPTEADFLFEGAGQGCTFVMTARLFVRLQRFVREHPLSFAKIHYHDWAIYALSRCWALRWTYDSTPRMVYRQHAANDTGAKSSWGGIARRLHMIDSGWYASQVTAMLALCRLAAPDDPRFHKVDRLMARAKKTLPGRLAWCAYLLLRSRRSLSDRIVLFLFASKGRV